MKADFYVNILLLFIHNDWASYGRFSSSSCQGGIRDKRFGKFCAS